MFLALDDDLDGDLGLGDLTRLAIVPDDDWRHALCLQPLDEKTAREDDALPAIEWVRKYFPHKVKRAFSKAHRAIWKWAEQVTPDYAPPMMAAIMPRGAGKTTTLDLVTIYLLATGRRKFALIVASSMTKSMARVNSLQTMMATKRFRARYADVSLPAIGDKGNVKGWSKRVLRTVSGAVVVAASLEGSITRGLNEDAIRPDLIILDDLDDQFDTAATTEKKEQSITSAILPTEGEVPAAVIFIQNLIKKDGIAGRIVSRKSDWAQDATVIGPIPAVEGLEYKTVSEDVETPGGTVKKVRHVITAGTPTWEGQSLEVCQRRIDRWGLWTFLLEQQHATSDFKGALWNSSMFQYLDKVMPLETYGRRVVGVDPSGGADVAGIVVVAGIFPRVQLAPVEDHVQRIVRQMRGEDKPTKLTDAPIFHVLAERSAAPGEDWAEKAILTAVEFDAEVWVETNYGSEMVIKALKDAARTLRLAGRISRTPKIEGVWAKLSKPDRMDPVVKMYIDGRVWHSPGGVLEALETEQTTWKPPEHGQRATRSPNLIDALVHAVNVLATGQRRGIKPLEAGTADFLG